MTNRRWLAVGPFVLGLCVAPLLLAQPGEPKGDPKQFEEGKGGRGKGGGFGGPPGMGQQRKIVKDFDTDKNGRLDTEERKLARASVKKGAGGFGFGFGGPPGGGFFKGGSEPKKPGPKVSPDDVKSIGDAPLYDSGVLRTIFLEFDNRDDWEAELADFHGTDVELPATLIADGKKYPGVGVHFRGMSSYMMVPAGAKRSLNVAIDFTDPKQRLLGAKTLNLLNSHEDGSFLSSVLYSHIGGQYLPTPKANLVKVVINGESWGVYTNVQQFNKEFLDEHFQTTKGARWKVSGSPAGGGGLDYIGDNLDDYRRRYEIKSKDDDKDWKALIELCKTLSTTPAEKLEEALQPILDIDGVLRFLALDNALINLDGYWIRASDYSLFRDEKGVFHVFPHDMNEAFKPANGGPGGGMGGPGGGMGGPGGGMGGPGGGMFGRPRLPAPGTILPDNLQEVLELTPAQKKELGLLQNEVDAKLEKLLTDEQRVQLKSLRDAASIFAPPGGGPGGPGGGSNPIGLDPLVGMTDARKPLRSKLLAVPALKQKYLQYIRQIAEKSLDWKNLGPVVAGYRALAEKEIEADTRKLSSIAEFRALTADELRPAEAAGRRGALSLRGFADQRREFLLNHAEVKKIQP